jgi:hypothetical protein
MTMKRLCISAALLMLMATPAQADDDAPEAPPKAYTDLVACRAISDADQRLACFDSASATMEQAREAKEIVLLDRAAVKKTRKSLFGFSLPKLPFFGGDDDDEEEEDKITEITSTIQSAQSVGYGKWLFTIPDGGTWQSTEALAFEPREGQAVTIKKSLGGGYMVRIGKGPMKAVKRVN